MARRQVPGFSCQGASEVKHESSVGTLPRVK